MIENSIYLENALRFTYLCVLFVSDSKTKVTGVSKERRKAKQIAIKLLLVGKNRFKCCSFLSDRGKRLQICRIENLRFEGNKKKFGKKPSCIMAKLSFGGKFFSVKDIAF